jgi:hypothetical protein
MARILDAGWQRPRQAAGSNVAMPKNAMADNVM